MPLQCNIDAKGKATRLIWGIVILTLGVVLGIFWARGNDGALPWIVSILLIAAGGFMIFEARNGWCVLRAMGFKTPI